MTTAAQVRRFVRHRRAALKVRFVAAPAAREAKGTPVPARRRALPEQSPRTISARTKEQA